MLGYAAQARYSKLRQCSIHATVEHNNIKKTKGHHPNTPPLWETSRAQHCKALFVGDGKYDSTRIIGGIRHR
jgi:lysozyme family protein